MKKHLLHNFGLKNGSCNLASVVGVIVVIISGSIFLSTISLAATVSSNCGVTSTLALAQVKNKNVSVVQEKNLFEKYPEVTVSLLDVQNMANSLGIPLTGVKSTFNELLIAQKAAIIHLQNPGHFVLMLDGNQKWVRLLETPDGMISIVPRSDIEKRFDGYALIASMDSSDTKAPAIDFAETNFQTSVTGIGQQVKHAYSFTNTGKQPLKIAIKSTSCGCTSAFIGKEADAKTLIIAPGAGGSVQVSMNVHEVGRQEQMVTLQTNDPQRPLVYLTIVATSPQNIEVSPVSLYLNSDKGQAISRSVQIIGPTSMKILSVETDQADLTTTLQNGDKNSVSHTWTINAIRSASAKVGDYKATVKIHTDDADRPLITIPVTGQVSGDLEVTPSSAFFGFIKIGQKQNVTVTIQSRSGTPFQITNVKLEGKSSPLLQINDQDKGNNSVHHISIELNPSQAVFLQGKLMVETNVEGEKTLEIPVTGLVQR